MMNRVTGTAVAGSGLPQVARTGEEELLWAYREDLTTFVRTLCRDPGDAEDIAHDALVRAARAAGLRDGRDLGMWLHRLAALECRRARRRRHDPSLEALLDRIVAAGDDDPSPDDATPAPDPEALAVELETRREVLAALDRLPDRYRSALVLRDGAGASLADVARALSTTPEAAKALVHRAREALRKAVRRPI